MRLPRLLSNLPIASALLLGGCSQATPIDKVVSASPEVLRDCDRLGMKVLLASYAKAAENQGRLVSFISETNIPIKGKPIKGSHVERGGSKKNNLYLWENGKVATYGLVYYVDDNNQMHSYAGNSTEKQPLKKYWDSPNDRYDSGLFFVSTNGKKDNRQEEKSDKLLTCNMLFKGEGEVHGGVYSLSTDYKKVDWVISWSDRDGVK